MMKKRVALVPADARVFGWYVWKTRVEVQPRWKRQIPDLPDRIDILRADPGTSSVALAWVLPDDGWPVSSEEILEMKQQLFDKGDTDEVIAFAVRRSDPDAGYARYAPLSLDAAEAERCGTQGLPCSAYMARVRQLSQTEKWVIERGIGAAIRAIRGTFETSEEAEENAVKVMVDVYRTEMRALIQQHGGETGWESITMPQGPEIRVVRLESGQFENREIVIRERKVRCPVE